MNLSRVIPLLVVGSAAGGGAIAAYTGHDVLVGVASGFLIGLSPLLLLGLAYAFLVAWRPDRPACRNGRCRADDYEFLEWPEGARKEGTGCSYCYQCRCGDRYVQRGTRFVEIAQDATEKPFMALSKWGRWLPDTPCAREPAGAAPAGGCS